MIAVLETDAALEALAPEWDAFWRRTPEATPFQSPHWLLAWWRQFGTAMPRIAVERRGGALTGLLPLYVLDEPGQRKLMPIGAGTSDYLDALGDPAPLLRPVLERARADRVDVCDLIEIPPGSALLHADAPQGWCAAWHESSACPVLSFPDIPARIRRKLRMSQHRAERGGGWTVETAGLDTVQPFLAELVRLHQSRWTAQGEPGSYASPAVLACQREAAPALMAAGALRLQVLHYAGTIAAAILALLAPGRILFYLSGFDEAHGFVSPGTILLGAMLEQAMAEGRTEAHFLRGREAYKYAWGGIDRMNMACRLTPRLDDAVRHCKPPPAGARTQDGMGDDGPT